MKFLNFISYVKQPILLEAAFDKYRMVLPEGLKSDFYEFQKRIDSETKWTVENLKREDRIIWYLRIYKFDYILPILTNPDTYINGVVPNKYKKQYGILSQKMKPQVRVNFDRLKTQLYHHIVQTNIPAVQNYVFEWQSPDVLLSDLDNIEREYFEAKKRIVTHSASPGVPIIKFTDGYAWYDLERSYCDAEGESMGHCGNNQGSSNDDQTVLSLRKTVEEKDGEIHYEPALTFILDKENHSLGEMKGRGNDKPNKKYHKYIIALLKSDYVERIKGGGYKPENNFNMIDLPQGIREQLFKLKPGLMNLEYLLKMDNPPLGKVSNKLEEELEQVGMDHSIRGVEQTDSGSFKVVLGTWNDLSRFCDSVGDEACGSIVSALENIDEINFADLSNVGNLTQFISILPEKYQRVMFDSVQIKYDHNFIPDVARKIISSRNEMYRILLDLVPAQKIKEQLEERLNSYIETNWYFEFDGAIIELEDENDLLDSTVRLVVSIDEMLNFINACASYDNEEDTDYSNFYGSIPEIRQNGFDSMSYHDNIDERRSEEGLTLMGEVDPLSTSVNLEDDDLVNKFIDRIEHNSNYVDDPRQGRLFDSRKNRFRRLK